MRAISFAALLLLAPATAFAHAHLKTSAPAGGSSVAAPTQVAIDFTEGVEPDFSSITVQSAAGAQVEDGKPHTAPGNNAQLIVGLKTLTPGVYTVTWHATAVDTHKTQGTFSFTVTP